MSDLKTVREALVKSLEALAAAGCEKPITCGQCAMCADHCKCADQSAPPVECRCAASEHWHHSDCPALKACPFCGPGQSVVTVYQDEFGYWTVGCGRCGSHSGKRPLSDPEGRSKVMQLWNQRPAEHPGNESSPCSPCPRCAEERERADSNYASCERIKRKFEEATAERDRLQATVKALGTFVRWVAKYGSCHTGKKLMERASALVAEHSQEQAADCAAGPVEG